MDESTEPVLVVDDGAVRQVRLSRPSVRNAFDAQLIARLTEVFVRAADAPHLRAMVLSGAGSAFCAGADLHTMRAAANASYADNLADAQALSRMFETLHRLPFLTIARVHGAALGGGGGLVAAVDVAIASKDTRFGFTEVRLGILPAVISPYVIAKIGSAHARRYFTTGEIFDGARAAEIGLVSEALEESQIDQRIAEILQAVATVGPVALREAKRLVAEVDRGGSGLTDDLAALIATIRASAEAREGLSAFLEKRPPTFREDRP